MIIKHIVELETIINEESPEPVAKVILAMREEVRNAFFQVAGTEMIIKMLEETNANEGHTWAELRVAQPK